MNRRSILPTIAGLLLSVTAMAQSVNIDLGENDAPAPGSGYRGAGMPGVWNKFDALASGFEYPLVGLDGQPIVGTVDQLGGTEIQTVPMGNPGDPRAGDAIFMGDALITHTSIENCLFFDALEPGTYEVLTYAWMPIQPTAQNKVRVDFNPTINLVGGSWPGAQTEGVTFARHFVDVSETGFLGTHSGVPDGGDFVLGAALNGVQIRKLEPEPPLFPEPTELRWLASLNADSYDVVQGDLAILRATGKYAQAAQACLGDDTVSTSQSYGADPLPGQAQWFVLRGVTATGNETYDSPGGNQPASRDAGLDLSPNGCP